jgi:hypothetical protein
MRICRARVGDVVVHFALRITELIEFMYKLADALGLQGSSVRDSIRIESLSPQPIRVLIIIGGFKAGPSQRTIESK